YSFGEERLGQGRDNSIAYLTENRDIAKEVYSKIRMKLGLDNGSKKEKSKEEPKPEKTAKK
ncbi:MAG: DNA recombination/repair protein RecA, partial [Candidatus Zixiibacteriota bacterium]